MQGETHEKNENRSAGDSEASRVEITSWFQEHANLCSVLASLAGGDVETQNRIRARMMASLDRGRSLVLPLFEARGHSVGATTLGNEASHISATHGGAAMASATLTQSLMRKPPAIPLSGVQRFDDGHRQLLNGTGGHRTSASIPAGVTLSPTAPRTVPLPSRTYLKKSSS